MSGFEIAALIAAAALAAMASTWIYLAVKTTSEIRNSWSRK